MKLRKAHKQVIKLKLRNIIYLWGVLLHNSSTNRSSMETRRKASHISYVIHLKWWTPCNALDWKSRAVFDTHLEALLSHCYLGAPLANNRNNFSWLILPKALKAMMKPINTSLKAKQPKRVFAGINPFKHSTTECLEGKDKWCKKAVKGQIVDPRSSVESLFEGMICFIRAINSVTEYAFLFFLSCIQSPHYIADMQHHIKCDHREQKPGHGRFQTAKRLIINVVHMSPVSVTESGLNSSCNECLMFVLNSRSKEVGRVWWLTNLHN